MAASIDRISSSNSQPQTVLGVYRHAMHGILRLLCDKIEQLQLSSTVNFLDRIVQLALQKFREFSSWSSEIAESNVTAIDDERGSIDLIVQLIRIMEHIVSNEKGTTRHDESQQQQHEESIRTLLNEIISHVCCCRILPKNFFLFRRSLTHRFHFPPRS